MNLCRKEDKWIVLAGHPIFFFFMPVQKRLRKLLFAYGIGDYFPGNDWKIRLFENIKKYYHNHISIAYYLSDRINIRMNNEVKNTIRRRTVSWGMRQIDAGNRDIKIRQIAFIGVIKPSQNVEVILEFLRNNPSWKLKLIGVAEGNYLLKLKEIIDQYSLQKQVWFPNKFISEKELKYVLSDCLIGLALYKTDKSQFTWYTDPGKIKTYLEFGLPVIMTDTSVVTRDIIGFHCGEIIKRRSLEFYINKVMKNYSYYLRGVRNMVKTYEYETYYDLRFTALRD